MLSNDRQPQKAAVEDFDDDNNTTIPGTKHSADIRNRADSLIDPGLVVVVTADENGKEQRAPLQKKYYESAASDDSAKALPYNYRRSSGSKSPLKQQPSIRIETVSDQLQQLYVNQLYEMMNVPEKSTRHDSYYPSSYQPRHGIETTSPFYDDPSNHHLAVVERKEINQNPASNTRFLQDYPQEGYDYPSQNDPQELYLQPPQERIRTRPLSYGDMPRSPASPWFNRHSQNPLERFPQGHPYAGLLFDRTTGQVFTDAELIDTSPFEPFIRPLESPQYIPEGRVAYNSLAYRQDPPRVIHEHRRHSHVNLYGGNDEFGQGYRLEKYSPDNAEDCHRSRHSYMKRETRQSPNRTRHHRHEPKDIHHEHFRPANPREYLPFDEYKPRRISDQARESSNNRRRAQTNVETVRYIQNKSDDERIRSSRTRERRGFWDYLRPRLDQTESSALVTRTSTDTDEPLIRRKHHHRHHSKSSKRYISDRSTERNDDGSKYSHYSRDKSGDKRSKDVQQDMRVETEMDADTKAVIHIPHESDHELDTIPTKTGLEISSKREKSAPLIENDKTREYVEIRIPSKDGTQKTFMLPLSKSGPRNFEVDGKTFVITPNQKVDPRGKKHHRSRSSKRLPSAMFRNWMTMDRPTRRRASSSNSGSAGSNEQISVVNGPEGKFWTRKWSQ